MAVAKSDLPSRVVMDALDCGQRIASSPRVTRQFRILGRISADRQQTITIFGLRRHKCTLSVMIHVTAVRAGRIQQGSGGASTRGDERSLAYVA